MCQQDPGEFMSDINQMELYGTVLGAKKVSVVAHHTIIYLQDELHTAKLVWLSSSFWQASRAGIPPMEALNGVCKPHLNGSICHSQCRK